MFDLETGTILKKGWRAIVLDAVDKGACSIEQARKIFCSSLGEQPFDHADYYEKLRLARRGTEHEDQRTGVQILKDAGAGDFSKGALG